MQNCCNYEIHIKGKKKAALMMCAITPYATNKNIVYECGNDDCYIVHLVGNCNGPLDEDCSTKVNATINTTMSEEEMRNGLIGKQFWDLTLRQKSELLGLELLVRSWSKQMEFDQLEKYKNGYFISIEGMEYNEDNQFEFEF